MVYGSCRPQLCWFFIHSLSSAFHHFTQKSLTKMSVPLIPAVFGIFLIQSWPELCGNLAELRGFNQKKAHHHCACASSAMSLLTWPLLQRYWGMSVRAPQTIPEREVLSVVVIEEEVMVDMVSSTIDQTYQGGWDAVFPIMYGNGPDIDKDKEWEVNHLQCKCKEHFTLKWQSLHCVNNVLFALSHISNKCHQKFSTCSCSQILRTSALWNVQWSLFGPSAKLLLVWSNVKMFSKD